MEDSLERPPAMKFRVYLLLSALICVHLWLPPILAANQPSAPEAESRWIENFPVKSMELEQRRKPERPEVLPFYGLEALLVGLSAFVCWLSRETMGKDYPTPMVFFRPSPLHHSLRRATVYAFIAAFPAIYYWRVWEYSVNIPSWDDFDAILAYMNLPLADRLTHLAAQHNEHRILTTRLSAELVHFALGHVDFKAVILWGNAALLGVLLIFKSEWSRLELPLACLAAVSAILFTPAPWTNAMWAMAAVQNNWVHFLAFLCAFLFFGFRGTGRRLASLASGALAAFTSASGIVIFPALLVTLAARLCGRKEPHGDERGQQLRDLLAAATGTAVVAFSYFARYETHPGHPSMAQSLAEPLHTLNYFLFFTGSAWNDAFSDPYAAFFIGLALLLLGLLVTVAGGYRKSPVLYSTMTYLFLSAAATSAGRAGFGIPQALDVRYKIVSLLLTACLLGLGVRVFPRVFRVFPVQVVLLSALCIHFAWSGPWTRPLLEQRREALIMETAGGIIRREGLHYPRGGMEHAGRIFNEAVAKGVYRIPDPADLREP